MATNSAEIIETSGGSLKTKPELLLDFEPSLKISRLLGDADYVSPGRERETGFFDNRRIRLNTCVGFYQVVIIQ